MSVLSHVAVIGAGPAGCSVACHLARAGVRVTLIESKVFPRVKVCGEYVSPAGTDDLESLLSPEELRHLGAARVDRFSIAMHTGGRDRRVHWRTPVAAWALSRATLDEALVARGVSLGVEMMQPAAVRDVAYHERGARVRLTDGREVDASLVVHADATGRHDGAGPISVVPGLVGLKCHARLPRGECEDSTVEMRAGRGQYVGCVRVEGGLATIALCARASLVRAHAGDHDAMVTRCWPTWDKAWRTTEWIGSPVPRSRFVASGHARSFRVGNAAGAVDPVGGEGIASALWSGRTLAGLLVEGNLTEAELGRVHARYAGAYAARLRTRLPACRLGAEVLMRPWVVGAIWPALRAPSISLRPWYALTGKPMRPDSTPTGAIRHG